MTRDAQGNALTLDSEAAGRAFDHVIEGFLKYRFDTSLRLKAFLAENPGAPIGQLMAAAFALLAYDRRTLPRVQTALDRAAALPMNPREAAHHAALSAWAAGRPEEALTRWEAIVADAPRDLLAFRLHHFTAFWMGATDRMLALVSRILPHWSPDVPGFGSVLACRCFAEEEAGHYITAERAGRAAVALDPADLWATHGVAHVLEMQGRRAEGIAWITAQQAHFDGGNNLMHHIWWHQAMFHIQRGEHDAILDLYDTRFRNLASPVTAAVPDLYIDMQNAASMLFRLELRGVGVGNRWDELAEKAAARVGDTLSSFTQPHWMMALAATGRDGAADAMEAALVEAASAPGTHATILREAALPACRAARAHRAGRHADVLAHLRPALPGLYRLGGSHAQQEVLELLFLDSARRVGARADVALALERAGAHHLAPARRVGFAEASLT